MNRILLSNFEDLLFQFLKSNNSWYLKYLFEIYFVLYLNDSYQIFKLEMSSYRSYKKGIL